MATTTIHKWGNGNGILIPRAQLEALGLKRGDKVEISVSGGTLEVRPAEGHRVEDLLNGYSGSPPQEYGWGAAAGKEMW
jgi:antitoxin MazE